MNRQPRSTVDLVVIILAATIGGVIIVSVIGIIVMKMTNPSVDVKSGSEAIQNIVTTIVGALVGFIGGRATGKLEANGKAHT